MSNKIFTIAEEFVIEDNIGNVPDEWLKIWGALIGPAFAAALLAIDPSKDVVHVLHSIRMMDGGPLNHVAAMSIGPGLPVACVGDGEPYQALGLRTVKAEGSIAEGLLEMLEREETGRLKYAAHLSDALEERRKDHGDLLGAICVGIMMKASAAQLALQQRSARTQQIADDVDFDVWEPNR